MKSLAWYGRRFFKYYIQNPGYRVVYGSFKNYCRCRSMKREGSNPSRIEFQLKKKQDGKATGWSCFFYCEWGEKII